MRVGFIKDDFLPTLPRAAFRNLRRAGMVELMAAGGILAFLGGIVVGTMAVKAG